MTRAAVGVKPVVFTTLKYASLVLGAIIVILPLVLLFTGSFKDKLEFVTTGPFDLPENWFNFSNYVTAFTRGNMVRGFINTIFYVTVSLVATVLIGAGTAYALDRFAFRGRGLVLALFLLATLVPGVTTQVATFQIVAGLGLYNSPGALILLFIGTDIIAIYIFLQFMRSIPISMDEAATIDGAGHYRIFFQMILPNLKPAIATVAIVKGVGIYNEFYTPFLYLANPEYRPISTSLFAFVGVFGAQWEIIAAGTIITIVPILILFLVLQKWVYSGFAAGSVK